MGNAYAIPHPDGNAIAFAHTAVHSNGNADTFTYPVANHNGYPDTLGNAAGHAADRQPQF